MHNTEGSWDDGFEASWKAFRAAVSAKLGALGSRATLCVEVAQNVELAVSPYVLVTAAGSEAVVRAEVSGNFWLDEAHRMDASQERRLAEIGWTPPVGESEAATANFTAVMSADDLDWLAVMAVRTLREVFGVVHPAFLLVDGDPYDASTVGHAQPEAEVAWPDCRERLVDLVDQALAPVFGHVPTKDDDGDIPVLTGQSVVFVQVHPAGPFVDLYAELVLDVAETARALVEVNILNRTSNGLVYLVRDDRIIARQRVSAAPFVPEHLRDVLASVLGRIDDVAGDLVARLGGRRFAEDLPAKTRRRPQPASRTWIQTLIHLEDDQPGSVSDVLAAHIFHLDQRAILDQITRQRRAGRPDLADLLRRALRVVVEHEARQRSLA